MVRRAFASLCLGVAWLGAGAQPGKDIYLEIEIQPPAPYVQQQALFIMRVFTTKPLNGSVTQLSPRDDVVVHQVGKMQRSRAAVHGKNYQVFEQRTLFFAQKSGELRFAPIVLTGNYIENNQRFGVREQSQPVRVAVRPTPASFPGGFWLPAKSVRLEERWSGDPAAWRAGDPLTRTLSLFGQGVAANQLPEIEWPQLARFNSYLEKARLDERLEGQEFFGERHRNVVMIPSRPGLHTLPAIRVPWWNTLTDRLEYAELPARTLEIAEGEAGAVVMMQETPGVVADVRAPPVAAPTDRGAWPWVSAALAAAWFATVAFFYRAALAGLWAGAWTGTLFNLRARGRGAGGLRARRRRLRRACLAGDAPGAARALVDWAQLAWSLPASATPAAVARRVANQTAARTAIRTAAQTATTDGGEGAGDDLQRELAALDRALYGGDARWSGAALWRAFCDFRRARAATPATPETGNNLETLHKL